MWNGIFHGIASAIRLNPLISLGFFLLLIIEWE